VPFHVDAVGRRARADPRDTCHIDLLTLSSNDLYGRRARAIWVRPTVKLAPLTVGGGQEQGYRSGTENLPGIPAWASQPISRASVGGEAARLGDCRSLLSGGLLARISEPV